MSRTETTTHGRMLGGLAPQTWDRLAGDRFYSTSAWLSFCATDFESPSDAVVAWSGGEPACAVPVVELTRPPSELYDWSALLAGHGLPPLPAGGLLVGSREGYQTHLLGPATQERGSMAVAEVVRQLRRRHAEGGDSDERSCVAMYVSTADALALRDAGVSAPPVLLEPDAWIELPAGGWPGWLASLPKKRRRSARCEARNFRDAGYRVEHLALSACYERLGSAAAATQAKYGYDDRPEDYLAALRNHVRCMGSAARVAVCSLGNGDPVGFCLYYVCGEALFLRWAGFDYERLTGADEYFNTVYYSQIEIAAGLGVRRIHAGLKATTAKALRGARLRPLWLVDLAPNSPLEAACERVLAHNDRVFGELAADSRTAPALVEEDWRALL